VFFERQLIYLPSRGLLDSPADYGLAYDEVWATADDGLRVHGWALLPATAPHAWLLYSHGNAGNISLRPAIAQPLVAAGIGVLLYDYRGYGRSEGRRCDEAGTYRDGEAMLDEALRRAGDSRRVFLFGESLGGGVSHELALRRSGLGGLITSSTFTSLPALARRLLPVGGLARLMSTRYDNLGKLARLALPRLVLHGRQDELVPFAMAEALRDATIPPAELVAVDGAGHNDLFDIGASTCYPAMLRFIDRHLPDP
jgi:uncharacterized protein